MHEKDSSMRVAREVMISSLPEVQRTVFAIIAVILRTLSSILPDRIRSNSSSRYGT